MEEEFEIEYASRTELVAFSSHVGVRITDGHRSEFADYDRLEAAIVRRLGDKSTHGLLLVVHHGTPSPSPSVLRHAAKAGDRRPPGARVVLAKLGLGFWSMTASAFIDAFLAALHRNDIRITTSVEAATQLLASELIGLNPDALLRAYEQLYEHMRGL